MNEGNIYSEHLYQRASQDVDALEKNASEYPFSSLAGFLLLYHYKKTDHPGFENLAKKIALQFNNPHWLQFQLNHQPNEITAPESVGEIKHEEKIIPAEFNNNLPAEISSEQNFVEENKIDKTAEEKKQETQNFEIVPEANEIKSESPSEILPEQNFQQEDDEKKENPEEPQMDNSFPKPVFTEAELSETTEETIAFEPLHTVDYFASQGIKINEELITNDKLGSQMKSFTEWLKSMKRLHPGRLAEQNIATEKLIQSAAEESNVNTEVLTEAMAEVLIKQDKKEKAIEMFTKLSLINPSKSAYFAARIESIKSS